ncbi:hypothetical protein ZWY2020_048843 [Hordeum vulgare]|nr:hypothetical protein ZWY2020_048843 [Hordeum vulgare]
MEGAWGSSLEAEHGGWIQEDARDLRWSRAQGCVFGGYSRSRGGMEGEGRAWEWPLAIPDQKDGPFREKVRSGWLAAVPYRAARAGGGVEVPLEEDGARPSGGGHQRVNRWTAL